jgi:hypothetical protein
MVPAKCQVVTGGGLANFFEVDPEDFARAADSARLGVEKTARVDPEASVHMAASGVPGSQAASALSRVGHRWQNALYQWSGLVSHYAAELDDARARYEKSDLGAGSEITWLADQL